MKNKQHYESLDKDSQEYIEYAKFNKLSNKKGYEDWKTEQDEDVNIEIDGQGQDKI